MRATMTSMPTPSRSIASVTGQCSAPPSLFKDDFRDGSAFQKPTLGNNLLQFHEGSLASAVPQGGRRSIGGAETHAVPEPQSGGGWEFPLSTEEKKHRVICLFESELAHAQRSVEEHDALVDENEALQAMLLQQEHVHAMGATSIATEMPRDAGSNAVSPLTHEVRESANGLKVGLAVFVAGIAVAVALVLLANPAGVVDPSAEQAPSAGELAPSQTATAIAAKKGEVVAPFGEQAPLAGELVPPQTPNATAAVQRMSARGLQRLSLRDCMGAEYWFKGAVEMLTKQDKEYTQLTVGDEEDVQWTKDVASVMGDWGFALVCLQRFEEGIVAFDSHAQLGGGSAGGFEAHHLNALGVAYFHLRDDESASNAFEAALEFYPLNPIIWSNYACARMVSGDHQAADDALDNALQIAESEEVNATLSEEQLSTIMSNIQNLADRKVVAMHTKMHGLGSADVQFNLPTVHLWCDLAATGGPEVPDSMRP